MNDPRYDRAGQNRPATQVQTRSQDAIALDLDGVNLSAVDSSAIGCRNRRSVGVGHGRAPWLLATEGG